MKEYTKLGLVLLMIDLILAIGTTVFMYSVYASVHANDLLGTSPSGLGNIWPATILGFIVSLLLIAGGLCILAGRQEFGEQHKQFITYVLILFVIYFFVIIIFSNVLSSAITDWIQASNGLSEAKYLQASVTARLIDSLMTESIFGLMIVFSFYSLEDHKGRFILVASYIVILIVPIVTYLGSSAVVNGWVSQGLLDASTNQTAPYVNTDLLPVSAWTGPGGIILLLFYLLQYVLLFVALFIPYRRIATGELSHPASQ